MKLIKDSDMRTKFLVVLLIFALYKIGTYIPTPGTNTTLLADLISSNQALGMANLFTGGSLANFSIFAIGIMPYITASIVIQMLSFDIVPTLSEWRRQGEMGEKKTKKLTYYVTFILAFIQGIGLSIGFNKMMPGIVQENVGAYILVSICLMVGTGILLILAEVIERKGLGKGISMIIVAGILMSMPNLGYQLLTTMTAEFGTISEGIKEFSFIWKFGLLAVLFFILTLAVIQVQRAERRLPIANTMNVNTKNKFNSNQSYLPMKLNPAGVIPAIFASVLFTVPQSLAMLFPNNSVSIWINGNVSMETTWGIAVFAVLIFVFTYFYSFIINNPEKMASDLQKNSSFVPGVRPGQETEDKIRHIMKHLLFVGASFLALLSIVPMATGMLMGITGGILIGGTSIIIIVNVMTEINDRVGTDTLKKDYKGFIKK